MRHGTQGGTGAALAAGNGDADWSTLAEWPSFLAWGWW